MTASVAENLNASSRSALSEKCGRPATEESPTQVQVESETCSHDLWRIALYYIYIEMSAAQVASHINLQREVCEGLGLNGRIRVSQEGVNGVLSGKHEVLRIYETRISQGLEMVSDCTDDNNNDDDDRAVDLDVKYCELRTDLPVEKQLFDRLIVKNTQNVIGLFDQSIAHEQQRQQQKLLKSERLRRRRERKRQQQEAKRRTKLGEDQQQEEQQQEEQLQSQSSITPTMAQNQTKSVDESNEDPSLKSLDISSLYRSVMEEPLNPETHLSGTEWNEKLDAVASSGKSALLLDVRNVYEMKVGHFVHPSTPTLLTNTRKYSDLPQMLACNKEMQERDQIFMYCTGGVRCERVSMLVRELYPEKEIFQLHGGIQRYLETCSEEKEKQSEENDTNTDSNTNNPGYFVGKNFVSAERKRQKNSTTMQYSTRTISYQHFLLRFTQVFDPRRTDPIHFGETVGRCLICQNPHDDYDNGHAPSENKESRCNTCRMLILICNDCRPKYRCHGEITSDDQNNSKSRPLLYCNVDTCIHEGSIPDPELLVAPREKEIEAITES